MVAGGCACQAGGDAANTGETDRPSSGQGACPFYGDVRLGGGTVRLEATGCGEIILDTFTTLGSGTLEHALFSDGSQLVVEIRAGDGGAVFEGFHAEGDWWVTGTDPMVSWRQGYQSAGAAGVFPLRGEDLSFDGRDVPEAGGDVGPDGAQETPNTSWWVGLVGRADGASVAAGATSATQTRFYTAFEFDRIHLIWGGRGESIPLEPGASIYLDPVWFGLGADPGVVLGQYAAAVAASHPIALPEAPNTGWRAWTPDQTPITEEDVRANLAVAEGLSGAGENGVIQVVQVDEGWQRGWGDWQANDDFPSGMEALAAEISAAGFLPGIWMAPFLVDRGTATYADNLDWFLHVDGLELDVEGRAVIDAAHPEARAWIAGQAAARVDEGYGYLELDRLYAGALEGDRGDGETGVSAYRLGMEAIREAVGEDTWILASGAPMLPSVGHADSWRSGPDIAPGGDPDPNPAYLRHQVRHTAARSFVNGRWWWNDSDGLRVREPLSQVEVTGAVVGHAVSGGSWFLADDLEGLGGDRAQAALMGDVMGGVGVEVTPHEPLHAVSGFDTSPVEELDQDDDRVPSTWVFSDGRTALLNLGEIAIEVEAPGGLELLSGEVSESGLRTLEPGQGEIWVEPGP